MPGIGNPWASSWAVVSATRVRRTDFPVKHGLRLGQVSGTQQLDLAKQAASTVPDGPASRRKRVRIPDLPRQTGSLLWASAVMDVHTGLAKRPGACLGQCGHGRATGLCRTDKNVSIGPGGSVPAWTLHRQAQHKGAACAHPSGMVRRSVERLSLTWEASRKRRPARHRWSAAGWRPIGA